MYVGRIEYEWEGKPHLYNITFVVRKPARQRKAPIAVLASSNTWLAYNSTAFAKPQPKVTKHIKLFLHSGVQGINRRHIGGTNILAQIVHPKDTKHFTFHER
jgi:hypothetical protein